MIPALIIFDFDGVIADSEMLANNVLSEVIYEFGHQISPNDALRLFAGKRSREVFAAIEEKIGHALPTQFASTLRNRNFDRLKRELAIIEGARDYIHAFSAIPQCIASQSSLDYLTFCLNVLGLSELFQSNVFSASKMEKGKPHPDIYLHAAEKMGVETSQAIVIEDSVLGVQAGVAAGATVIGLLAASHIQSGHEQVLFQAGAHHVAQTFADVADITRSLLAHA